LVRRQGVASLATRASDNLPYASLVTVAADHSGAPLLLISRLAEHTKNLEHGNHISLLFYDPPEPGSDPLTGMRASVVGRIEMDPSAEVRIRFLSRHPEAAEYADFADFAFHRVDVERVHLVAGFGQINWLDAGDVLVPQDRASAFAGAETGVIEHMNADHLDAIAHYASGLLGQKPGDWRMTGCDQDGLDLRDQASAVCARLEFDRPAPGPGDLRGILVNLATSSPG